MTSGLRFIEDCIERYLVPPERAMISTWAEKNIHLPSDTAEPGLYNLERAPYQMEILNAASPDNPAREITLVFGAQMGKTLIEQIIMAYYMKAYPRPQGFVFSNEKVLKKFVKLKFDPFIKANSEVADVLGSGMKRSGDTLEEKQYPGGSLLFLSANSATNLRSFSFEIAIMDEVDTYEKNLNNEGSPIDLVIRRTNTYSDTRKVIMSSTPVNDASLILGSLNKTTYEKYFVPCPHCKKLITLEWEYMRWELAEGGENVLRAWMTCPECGQEIKNSDKFFMLDPKNGAKWMPTNPFAPSTHRGFFLNTLYAPVGWSSWQTLVQTYIKAMNSDLALRESSIITFYNTILCRQYKSSSIDKPEAEELVELASKSQYERGKVPSWVGAITTGTDVQKNRFETTVMGWGKRGRHIVIDHIILDIPQGTDIKDLENPAWEMYAELVLNGTWTREDGAVLPSLGNGLDRGYEPTAINDFYLTIKEKSLYLLLGIDGKLSSGSLRPEETQPRGGRDKRGARFYKTPVSEIKKVVYADLKRSLGAKDSDLEPYGECVFPSDLPFEYYEQLTAEKYEYNTRKEKYEWVKTRERNEALDTFVYNYAIAYLIGINMWSNDTWDGIFSSQEHMTKKSKEAVSAAKKQERRKRKLSSGVV